MKQRLHEFLRFCIVGCISYSIDAGLLELLVGMGLTPHIARLFSMVTAMQCGYLLHSVFTYRGHGGFHARAWLTFMATNGVGAAINYGVFIAALHLLNLESALITRQAALVCGTAVALGFNHWANRKFVFRSR